MKSNSLLTPLGRGKYFYGGVLFILLTVATFWYQFRLIQPGHDVPQVDQLRWGYLVLIVFWLPLEPLILAFRAWIISRVLQPGIRFGIFATADLVNTAAALFTPAQVGGSAGQIYFLKQSGVQLGTALSVTVFGFIGTMIALLGIGIFSLFISDVAHTSALFTVGAVLLIITSGLMTIFGIWPGLFRKVVATISQTVWKIRGQKTLLHDWWPPDDCRAGMPDRMDSFSCKLVDVFYTYQANLHQYLQHGRWNFIPVCLLSLAFLLSRCIMAYFCVRFLGLLTSTFREIFETQIVLTFLIYFSPTPGSAGIAEAASLWIMGKIVPLGFAPYYNLLWRFTTVYVAAIAGLILLVHRILTDISTTPCLASEESMHSASK